MTLVEIIRERLDAGRHIADADVRLLVERTEKLEAALREIVVLDTSCIDLAMAVDVAEEALK